MNRKQFIKQSALAATATTLIPKAFAQVVNPTFPTVRIAKEKRNFTSEAIENIITEVQKNIGNKEIAWLFGNCFPNTLDTTVEFEMIDGKPDTYVITGDIDAMWLRDSTAQITPYLSFCNKDPQLKQLVKGVINRQVKCVLLDPYANAFYKDKTKISEWKSDLTKMQPGIHERKWEIDSLCYPIRLSFGYWKNTGDASIFDEDWCKAMQLILKTFKEQQRLTSKGSYTFQRTTAWATDGVPLAGYGYPTKPVGLICSMFRPSDDATLFPFLIPSNWFAVESLKQLHQLIKNNNITALQSIRTDVLNLATTVEKALLQYGIANTTSHGKVVAFEVNGFGSYHLMDDANVPSLLSLNYLVPNSPHKALFNNTRKYVLSENNPFYFKGKAGYGIGGPHTGYDMIWPISITMRGITSNDDNEIKDCIKQLQRTHANTGFMHESFHKDDANNFTRKWFAWANTLFGEFILKVYKERPHLLN